MYKWTFTGSSSDKYPIRGEEPDYARWKSVAKSVAMPLKPFIFNSWRREGDSNPRYSF
jgi:hypothetical protein